MKYAHINPTIQKKKKVCAKGYEATMGVERLDYTRGQHRKSGAETKGGDR